MLHSKAVNMDLMCITILKLSVWIRLGVIQQGGWTSVSLCFVLGFCIEVIHFFWLIMLLAIRRCR